MITRMSAEPTNQIEEEEEITEVAVKLPITGSLEPAKTKFFSDDIAGFTSEITNGKFTVFIADYKYNSDYDGTPKFVVNNLMNGFTRQLEDKRKYLFVAFKCIKIESSYTITSVWISNCTLPISEVIPDKYDDFTWTSVNVTDTHSIENVIKIVSKDDTENVITSYLH